jgi:3-hydroxyacyl-[acyl-carrier-protein] dehydratase
MATTEIRAIMDILPHRYPMLLIDRILELEHMVRAVGFKNVTANEPFFTGHFPGNPLFPGVLMIEAMAQLGGTMILEPGDWQRRIPYLAGIDKCKFRRPVIPGDRLMMEVKMLRHRKNIGWVEGSCTVDGQHVCSAELMFSIVTDTGSFKLDSSVLHE